MIEEKYCNIEKAEKIPTLPTLAFLVQYKLRKKKAHLHELKKYLDSQWNTGL